VKKIGFEGSRFRGEKIEKIGRRLKGKNYRLKTEGRRLKGKD
jgi:hypothetical protein